MYSERVADDVAATRAQEDALAAPDGLPHDGTDAGPHEIARAHDSTDVSAVARADNGARRRAHRLH